MRIDRADLLALAVLVLLPLLWFGPVLFTGKTLLPYDNLYTFEPWRSLRPGLIPHNALLSDLVLENAVWKLHIRRALSQGELPLWNPQIFTGIPFFAAGQASVAYPLSVLFYVLPLEAAYGWFTALQLAIAGINMYILGRVLKLRPLAALFSGMVFMFSGFMVVSVVFTMVIAAAAWLPLLLAIIEFIIQKQEEKGAGSFRPVPYVVAGAGVIGMVVLAGHPEFLYYTLLVAGMYTTVRLLIAWRRLGRGRRADRQGDKETGRQGDKVTRWQGDQSADHPISQSPNLQSPITQSSIFNLQSSVFNLQSSITLRLAKLALWLLLLAGLGVAVGGVQL
ncbi:MAG: hypothetical protein D6790_01105, partial [Caldilineae bacterium]